MRWWGKNHECTFQQVVSAWPHSALSFRTKIHLLPGFQPFIFLSQPSSNWGFHLRSTVYSSYKFKSQEINEDVNPDNELQLIPQSTKEKDSFRFSTDKNCPQNPKNVPCLYIPSFMVLLCTCMTCSSVIGSAAELAVATWSQAEKTRHFIQQMVDSRLEARRQPWKIRCLACVVHFAQQSSLIRRFVIDTWTLTPPEPPRQESYRER